MVQDTLFPLSALQTKGYAQPEPRNTADDTAETESAVETAQAA